jgi:hypothetical protein
MCVRSGGQKVAGTDVDLHPLELRGLDHRQVGQRIILDDEESDRLEPDQSTFEALVVGLPVGCLAVTEDDVNLSAEKLRPGGADATAEASDELDGSR